MVTVIIGELVKGVCQQAETFSQVKTFEATTKLQRRQGGMRNDSKSGLDQKFIFQSLKQVS